MIGFMQTVYLCKLNNYSLQEIINTGWIWIHEHFRIEKKTGNISFNLNSVCKIKNESVLKNKKQLDTKDENIIIDC